MVRARTTPRHANVVREIEAAGGRAVANFDDVSDYDASEQIIRTALNEYGQLDILCNVAGILRDRMIFNMTEAEWDAVIAVHLKGTFNTSKYASIYWRSERKGNYRLINFTSVSGALGVAGAAELRRRQARHRGVDVLVCERARALRGDFERDQPGRGDAHGRHGFRRIAAASWTRRSSEWRRIARGRCRRTTWRRRSCTSRARNRAGSTGR